MDKKIVSPCVKTWIERSAGIGNKQDLFSQEKKTDVNYRLKPYTKLEWEIASATIWLYLQRGFCMQVLNNNLFLQPTHNSMVESLCCCCSRVRDTTVVICSKNCCLTALRAVLSGYRCRHLKWWKHKMKNEIRRNHGAQRIEIQWKRVVACLLLMQRKCARTQFHSRRSHYDH